MRRRQIENSKMRDCYQDSCVNILKKKIGELKPTDFFFLHLFISPSLYIFWNNFFFSFSEKKK
jgi:hypothetical protein